MTAERLLEAFQNIGDLQKTFSYPYVRVSLISESFRDKTDSEREHIIAQHLKISIGELRRTLQNSLLLLRPMTQDENFHPATSRSTHWIAGLTSASTTHRIPRITTIHFYGYKGGQSRSTVLAQTALTLAQDGWRVLCIDADIEAPSLDTLFSSSSTSLSSTLLGVVQDVSPLQPLTVFVEQAKGGGRVDLLNCWPKGSSYSIDAAAFALRTALEPPILEKALITIEAHACRQCYDIILVDHRTGISPSTLPAMNALPGRVVVAIRLDEQWLQAKAFLKLVMRASTPSPGIFVIWKPDTEDTRSFNQRTYTQRDALLELLADEFDRASTSVSEDDEQLSPSDISDHLVLWPYDSVFRSQRLPDPQLIHSDNKDALTRIRSLLSLGSPQTHIENPKVLTNISGAQDQGDFISTRALRELLAPNNPFSYVVGRKGTGKTRLARELSMRQLGEPLLVAADSTEDFGIRSGAGEILDAISRYENNPERFWLNLFDSAIHLPSTDKQALTSRFASTVTETKDARDLISSWEGSQNSRMFLLDSLETTFPSRYMPSFLNSLFRVLSMIESDSRISDRIRFRLFLRRDLAQPGFVQNIEQQLYGKSFELSWDYRSILNFMLSRLSQKPWYAEHFRDLSTKLASEAERIREGSLEPLECERLLLLALPSTVRRNNLSTVTFLRTYFADSASERGPSGAIGSDDYRYYPRVFDDFLEEMSSDMRDREGTPIPPLEAGRIHQQRIFRAHEYAANKYLSGLKQELAYLISLSDDFGDNQTRIDRLLSAFDGRQTPFKIDMRVAELAEATSFAKDQVRSALDRMKDVGMFESRPDYPGEWRVGRLFKSSLRMKYVRGRAAQTDEESRVGQLFT